MGRGLTGQAFAQPFAHVPHATDAVACLQLVDGRDGRGHGHRLGPKRTGDEDLRGAVAEAIIAGDGGERIAVRDRLAPGGKVRPHAHKLPAAADVKAETRAHVVHDQGRSGRIAEGARRVGECRRRQLVVLAEIMLEGGDDDAGDVPPHRLGRIGEALGIVVVVGNDVQAVFRGRAQRVGIAPGDRAVIGAAGDQQLAPPGRRAGDHDAGRRRIGAVLLEHRPIGMRHGVNQKFGQLNEPFRRPVQPIAALPLRIDGRLDVGIPIAQHHRSPGAHEIDVLAPIDVPQAATFAAREELRIGRGQARRVLMAPHAAGNDPLCPRAQCGVTGKAG